MVEVAERLRPARAGRLAASRWGALFALSGAAGVVLHVWAYGSVLGVPNSDEAVNGLMTIAAMHGKLTTFFWGQSYGGSQEALAAVPVFWLFGPSWVALRIVPIAFQAVAAFLIWRIGLRTIGRTPAAVAAAAYWLWPPFLINYLTHAYGFYGSGVAYCALLLLLALRVVERPDRIRVGSLALVLGLAFWQTPQIVPIAAPVLAWTIWRRPRCLRQLWLAAPLAAIGALPWLIYNLHHDWASFALGDDPTTYQSRLRDFVSPVLPMTIGLRSPYTAKLLLPHLLTYLVYAALLVAFVVSAIRTRRRNVSILYAVAIVFPFIYAIAPKTRDTAEPRYLMIATPILALLVAQFATTYRRAIGAVLIACVLSTVTLHRMDEAVSGESQAEAAPRDMSPLVSTLDRLGLDHVYANYWIAYRLDFDTRERILAVHNKLNTATFSGGQVTPPPDPFPRRPDWEREIAAARHGFVLFRQDVPHIPIVPQLERHGYRRYTVQNFIVFAPPA
jgi:hypothetical protein